MRQKHADLIKAWADGSDIEYLNIHDGQWRITQVPHWDAAIEYRIKPQPKPDIFKYIHLSEHSIGDGSWITDYEEAHPHWGIHIKLTIDGETKKPKSVELV
jgi:hypothetical protein